MRKIEINSFAALNSAIGKFKREYHDKGLTRLMSNYFPNPAVHSQWIEDSAFEAWGADDGCLLMVHHAEFVDELYYFAVSETALSRAAEEIKHKTKRPLIVEQITKDSPLPILKPSRCLIRLTHTGQPVQTDNMDEGIEIAGTEDAREVRRILCTEFDPLTDRIPTEENFRQFAADGNILIIKVSSDIAAFLIYELSGRSIHLRYWWTDPSHRGKGIGGKLLKAFFRTGRDTTRQYLWVDETNDLALPRYEHYGFHAEGLKDYIQIFIP